MSEPDEAMVEAVASAVDLCVDDWNGEPWSMAQEVARAVLSVPVVRDALARDGRAGCHAITDDDGTTYCPLAEANMRAVACNCASYNNPEKVRQTVSGPVSEVVLTPPPELGIERETVCVDACIATVVQHLWSCGVVTLGSCCGHGRERPGLVLGQHEDMAVARACISGVDDRAWDLSQWRLVKNTDMNPANKERNDQ